MNTHMNDDQPAGNGLVAKNQGTASLCGCHSGTTERELLVHLACSPRHCTCSGRARTAEAEGWADLCEEVEVEDWYDAMTEGLQTWGEEPW